MPTNIREMVEKRRTFRKNVYFEASPLEFQLKSIVMSPLLHRPHRPGFGRDGDIPLQPRLWCTRKEVLFAVELPAERFKDDFLVGSAISELQFVRLLSAICADQAHFKPFAGIVGIGHGSPLQVCAKQSGISN